MAFAYPTAGAPALAAPTVHGYGLSTTPAVIPGVATPAYGGFNGLGATGFNGLGGFNGATGFNGLNGGLGGFNGVSDFSGLNGLNGGLGAFPGAGFGQDYSSLAAQTPIVASDNTAFLGAGAPFAGTTDLSGLYSGYGGLGGFDQGFGGAPFLAPSVYGGGYGGYGGYGANTVSGAIAAPVAPARKVWQNGLRRSLVTGHPTRF